MSETFAIDEDFPLGCSATLVFVFPESAFTAALTAEYVAACGVTMVDFMATNKLRIVDEELLRHYNEFVRPTLCGLTEATIVATQKHEFTPHGTTISHILSASHMVVHTYPERRAMVVNIGVCSKAGVEGLRHGLYAQIWPTLFARLRRTVGVQAAMTVTPTPQIKDKACTHFRKQVSAVLSLFGLKRNATAGK